MIDGRLLNCACVTVHCRCSPMIEPSAQTPRNKDWEWRNQRGDNRRGSRILQRRMSNLSERASEVERLRGWVWQGKIQLSKWCLYAFLEIFIDTVTALTTCFEHLNVYFFQEKSTIIKRAGVRTPWTPPLLDPPLNKGVHPHRHTAIFCPKNTSATGFL